MGDAIGKEGGVLFAAEVEPPHLPGVPPLVEVGRGLVVLEPSADWTVYNHLQEQSGGRSHILGGMPPLWLFLKLSRCAVNPGHTGASRSFAAYKQGWKMFQV